MTYVPTAKDRPYPAHARIIPTYNQERETSAYLCSLVTRAPYEPKGKHAA